MPDRPVRSVPRQLALAALTVRTAEWEPAWALLDRLAVRRGCRSARDYLDRVRGCPTWVAGQVARGNCLGAVADLSGLPVALVERWTPRVIGEGTVLGSALVTSTVRFNNVTGAAGGRGAVCPSCLAEDRDARPGPEDCRAHRRAWWTLPEFQACPVHRRLLLTSCPGCGASAHRLNVRPDRCSCGFDLAGASTGTAVGGLEDRLLALIHGTAPPAWADGMSLRALSGLALRVGLVDARGPRVRSVEALHVQERRELSGAGWDLLAGGAGAFGALLDRSVASGEPRSPRLCYGEIYRWLARTAEPGLARHRDALLAHAREALRPVRDVEVFGATVAGRPRVRTVERHSDHGGPPDRLCGMLGINRAQLVKLLAEDGSYRLIGWRGRYDLDATDRFLERIRAGVPRLSEVPKGMLRVLDSARVERSWPATMAAIRRGDIRVTGVLSGRKGLAGLVVSIASLRSALPIRRSGPEPAHTCAAAAALLTVGRETLAILRRRGLLRYSACLGPVDRLTMGPSASSLDAFRSRYVSGPELSRTRGVGLRTLCRLLDLHGVLSVIDFGRDVSPIFERSDANRVLDGPGNPFQPNRGQTADSSSPIVAN